MKSLRIAVLDEELPFPLTSGKRLRTFNLLSRLAEQHRITILAHRNADASEIPKAEDAFRRLGIDTVLVPRSVPSKSGPGFYARLAGNLLSPLPYSVESHTSPELIEAVRDYAAANPVDLWHCEWTPYAQVLRRALKGRIRRRPWVVMAHNIESTIWKRYVETEENPMKRWYIQRQAEKFEKFERWAFAQASWTIAVSEFDAELIRTEMGGTEQTEVVENGVDTDYFAPRTDIERDPHRFAFIGSLDWRPNQEGVRWLLEGILPRIRSVVPTAKLDIVGRNPPEWMKDQARRFVGVQVFGSVPDVRPHLAKSSLTVVPLKVGSGSRLKILESLATRTPVVSTTVGAEGLNLFDCEHLDLADDETGFAKAVCEVLTNPDEAFDRADVGRRAVLREYDWNNLSQKLEEIWTVAVEGHARKAAMES